MADQPEQWWYKPSTGEVERGRQSGWADRMGPYPTREAAEQAMTLAHARAEQWAAEEQREREEEDDW